MRGNGEKSQQGIFQLGKGKKNPQNDKDSSSAETAFPPEEWLFCTFSILETQNLTGQCLEQPKQLSRWPSFVDWAGPDDLQWALQA